MRREVAHKGLTDVEVEERFAYRQIDTRMLRRKHHYLASPDRLGTIGANLVVQADLEPKHLTT